MGVCLAAPEAPKAAAASVWVFLRVLVTVRAGREVVLLRMCEVAVVELWSWIWCALASSTTPNKWDYHLNTHMHAGVNNCLVDFVSLSLVPMVLLPTAPALPPDSCDVQYRQGT